MFDSVLLKLLHYGIGPNTTSLLASLVSETEKAPSEHDFLIKSRGICQTIYSKRFGHGRGHRSQAELVVMRLNNFISNKGAKIFQH